MPYFLIVIFLVYIIIFIKFKKKPCDKFSPSKEKLSVVIAAKNEENNIASLIKSLQKQNYDPNNFEVILVDDISSDLTLDIGKKLTENLSNYNIIKAKDKIFEGKRGALHLGIEHAKYNNIVVTDADCLPEPNFLGSFASKFSGNYDFVFGVAPFVKDSSLINKIACFDNLWVHILTFSFANVGLPYSAAARSFGFKKDAYKKLEGYKKTTETISGDDDLLLREAIKNKLKIGVITEPTAFVYSKTKSSLMDFIKQKSRHTSTSNYYTTKIKFVLGFWHLINFVMLFSPILAFISLNWILLLPIKILADLIIIKFLMRKFNYSFSLVEIVYLQFIYELLLIVFYFKGSFGKSEW